LIFLDNFFVPAPTSIASFSLKIVLVCAVVYSCCRVWQSHLRLFESLLLESSPASVKRFDIFLNSLVDASASDREREHFITSMLSRDGKDHAHSVHEYRSQTDVNTRETTREAELRAEMKRLYRRALDRSPRDAALMLDYC
jgi:hypothetical protein